MGYAERANKNPDKGKDKPVKKPFNLLLFFGIQGLYNSFTGRQSQVYGHPAQRKYKR